MGSRCKDSDSEDGEEPDGAFGLAFGTNGSTDEEGGADGSFGGAFGKSLGESPPVMPQAFSLESFYQIALSLENNDCNIEYIGLRTTDSCP